MAGAVFLCIWACQKEQFIVDSNLKLEFSADTLRFDTVFTELGSATRLLKVYNRHSEGILIPSISMAGSDQSQFRINVDGISTHLATNVQLPANDSIYIFAEVTVDPDLPLSESPFIIEEPLVFDLGNEVQTVLLEAWGQNANYLPDRFSAGTLNLLSCNLSTLEWSDPKPYVIYGILFIDSCQVVLPAGTKVYVHGGVARIDDNIFNDGLIVVLGEGSINSNGLVDDPVIIQGDRLEPEFGDALGQWTGIRFSEGSTGNSLENTVIKNSIVGIRADSASSLTLKSTQILNTSGSGLIGFHAEIRVENSLIHTNGNFGAVLSFGGQYKFYHTTIANFGNQVSALRMDNFRCTDPQCAGEILVSPLDAEFYNCIFTGSGSDEIDMQDALDGSDPEFFNYNFYHCIVRVEELLEADQFPNFFDRCENCINHNLGDTLFVNTDEGNFRLDTMSIAEMKGIPLPFISMDIEGKTRDSMSPDLGCFEFQE